MLDDVIHAGAEATLTWLTTKDPGLKQLLDEAYGYAVFPSLGRASAVLGGARGHGEVFEEGKPIGFATLTQMTVGLQVGGQTFSELILFGDKDTLDAFKNGMVRFTANASAVFVRGATGTTGSHAFVAKAYSRGGMLLEASLGGQKFTFHEHLPEKRKKRESKPRRDDTRYESKAPEETGEEGFESAREESTPDEAEAAAEETSPEEGFESAREESTPDEAEAAGETPPNEALESAPEEDWGYDAEAAAAVPEEGFETAPERDEGNDAVPSEVEPGGGASTATRAVGRSRPKGPNGSARAAEVVAKAAAGVKQRLAGSGRKLVGKVAHGVSKHVGPRGLKRVGLTLAARRYPTLVGKPLHLLDRIKVAATTLDNEATFGPALSAQVNAALRRMTERDPGLNEMLDKAYGYAVFPLVGKAAAALGVGVGRGEVFERGKLIGYAGIVQLTLGVQVGGETYDELIVFETESALERFKAGKLAFAANASAVIVKAGAAATTDYSSGTAVFVHPEGGLMLELGSGGQAFIFRRKVLGVPGVKAPEVKAPEVKAPNVEASKDMAPEVQPKAPVADETRHVRAERAPPEVTSPEPKAEGTTEEQKQRATEVARNAQARTKASVSGARTKATAAAARTKATVADARTAVKRGVGALMRPPRGRT